MKYKFNFSLASFGLTIIVMILNIMLILQSKDCLPWIGFIYFGWRLPLLICSLPAFRKKRSKTMDNFNPDTASVEELIEAVKSQVARIEENLDRDDCFRVCIDTVAQDKRVWEISIETYEDHCYLKGTWKSEDTLIDTLKSALSGYTELADHVKLVSDKLERYDLSICYWKDNFSIIRDMNEVKFISGKNKTFTEKLLAVEKWLDKQVKEG